MNEREALKLALEALEGVEALLSSMGLTHLIIYGDAEKAITNLSQALAEQEPVAIEYWLQDTMESGRWVTTDNMEKATAEKMLSGEYGNVYPQGRIVDPSPPQRTWVGLTDEDKQTAFDDTQEGGGFWEFADAIEAKLKEKNT